MKKDYWLIHYTDRRNLDRIKETRTLQSALCLMVGSGEKYYARRKREESILLKSGVVLRDQEPLTKEIDVVGGSFNDFVGYLNKHVFFWPDNSDSCSAGTSFRKKYQSPEHVGLRCRLCDLVAANPEKTILFSPVNSGSKPRYLKQSKPRHLDLFQPLESRKGQRLIEIVVEGKVRLPDNTECEDVKWRPLFRDCPLFPTLPPVTGVKLAAVETGMKYRGRDDLLLAVMSPGTAVAGVLTRSAVVGAPVEWCRRRLSNETGARALIVNAGNANTFTGEAGRRHVRACCEAVAAAVGCRSEDVLAASTGVIGEPLAVEKITAAVPQLAAALSADAEVWKRAAAAILTTDTYPKGATARTQIGDATVTINGIAKGSGMIAPDMATMLAFVFTDAAIPRPVLHELLAVAVEKSFNAITVDGDASTSDTCLLFATGKAGNPTPVAMDDSLLNDFRVALETVMTDLAQQIVRDGEGAQKFVTVTVRGAENDRAAKTIAKSVANSPLVKTAIAGEDANWGRIVMAVGNAGEAVKVGRLVVAIGGVTVTRDGRRSDDLDEAPLTEHLKGDEVLIEIDLALGDGHARVWTCDLTHGYIDINASYRS